MRTLFVFSCFVLLCLNSTAQYWPGKAQQIHIADINGKRGLVRPYYPHLIGQPVYDEITWLGPGSFFIKQNNFYGILDTFGVEKIKPDTYTHAIARTDIEPGKTLASFYTYNPEGPGQSLLADENGNVLARNFYEIKGKRGNLIIVTVSTGDSIQRRLFFEKDEENKIFKYGILKTDGSWLIKPGDREFYFISPYCIAATEHTNSYRDFKFTLLNRDGKPIIEKDSLNYDYDRQLNDSLHKLGQICVQNATTKWFVDSMGTIVSKHPRPLSEGKNGVQQPGLSYYYTLVLDSAKKTYTIYDKSGKLLAATNFISVYPSYYRTKKREPMIDKDLIFGQTQEGTFLLDKKFKPKSVVMWGVENRIYSDGKTKLFIFNSKNRHQGVMNQDGKIIVEPLYENKVYEENNLIYAKTDHYTVDVYEPNGTRRFKDISAVKVSTLNPAIAYVRTGSLQAIYSLQNFKVIIPNGMYTGFEELPKYNNVIASKDNEKFILDKNFRLLTETSFTKIDRDSFALVATTLNKKQLLLGLGQTKPGAEYDAVYNACRTCLNKVYLVKNNDKYGLINYKGKLLLKCEWDTLLFVGKKTVARTGAKYYLTDTNYVLSKKVAIDSIKLYCWGAGALYKINNKWHLLDERTDKGIEFDEGTVECSNMDLISIKDKGKYGVYSRVKRKWMVNPVFDSAVIFTTKYNDNRHFYFTQKNRKNYFVDTLANGVIGNGFDFIEPMQLMTESPNSYLNNHLVNNGGAVSRSVTTGAGSNIITAGKFGIANSRGELLHALDGDQAIALLDENYGYYDYDGWPYSNVLGFLWNNGGTVEEYTSYLTDSVGQVQYDVQGNEHIVKVAPAAAFDKKITGGKFGILGADGKDILPVIYDRIVFLYAVGNDNRELYYRKSYSDIVYSRSTRDRLLLFPVFLQKDHKWGAADLSGKIIVPIEYDSIADFSFEKERTIQVWKNGRYGFFDLLGNRLLPVDYTGQQDYDTYSQDDTFTAFSILQKNGSMKEYNFVRKVEQINYNEDGEEKVVMISDTMRFHYFSGGQLGIFDPGNFKPLLTAEYDDIRFMQHALQKPGDPSEKVRDVRLSLTEKHSLAPSFTSSEQFPFFEIKRSGHWGIYVFNKGIIVEPQYDDVQVIYSLIDSPQYAFDPGERDAMRLGPAVGIKFKQSRKWGLMNTDGKIILKAEYESISLTEDNLYKTIKAGKTNFFNTSGEPVQAN